ncbi:MAG: DNA polymerase III subunit beta [bacterium]|nr:DNA polymerase III subunit beta [bacterium]
MKIEGLKDTLQEAVRKAEKITGKNLTLPILSCILFEAKDNRLTLKATNLDLGLELIIPVKVKKEGKVVVPAAILNGFLSNLNNDKNVSMELEETALHITTSSSSTIIKTFPLDDFPTIPRVKKDKSFKILASDVVKGLRSVWYSASVSNMKPELASIYLYSDDEALVFVATDSFRLAEKKVRPKRTVSLGQILIPFKNAVEIIRILENIKEEIEITMEKNQIAFSYNNFYLTSRVIDGVFPDYKQIIPKDFKTEVVVLKQDLISSLKLANVFADTFNQVNMKALAGSKAFQLKTKNTEVGENTNKVGAVLKGEDVDINFNYKYVIDCFQSIEADSVALQFNGLNRPMLVRGVSDKSFLYLVMPMNK